MATGTTAEPAGAYSAKVLRRGDRLNVGGWARLMTDMGAVSGLSLEERIEAAKTHLHALDLLEQQQTRNLERASNANG